MMIVSPEQHLLNPIDEFIKTLKQTQSDAKLAEQESIYDLCANMLDTITLLRDDSDRLDKMERLNLIKTDDLRCYIDNLQE